MLDMDLLGSMFVLLGSDPVGVGSFLAITLFTFGISALCTLLESKGLTSKSLPLFSVEIFNLGF